MVTLFKQIDMKEKIKKAIGFILGIYLQIIEMALLLAALSFAFTKEWAKVGMIIMIMIWVKLNEIEDLLKNKGDGTK